MSEWWAEPRDNVEKYHAYSTIFLSCRLPVKIVVWPANKPVLFALKVGFLLYVVILFSTN